MLIVGVDVLQLNSPMNSVSSTEDIKPPLGINGVMKVPAQPSGTMLSLTKHICAICGDRSSGEWRPARPSTQHQQHKAKDDAKSSKSFCLPLYFYSVFIFILKKKKKKKPKERKVCDISSNLFT